MFSEADKQQILEEAMRPHARLSEVARRATICSLIVTAKLNNVEPFASLRDVLQRMTDGHPASRLDELLPWNWQPKNVNP
jgi:hypothetical protein